MKAILPLSLLVLILSACASSPSPNRSPGSTARPGPNCDEQFASSTQRLQGLKKIYETYRELSFDLAVKFVPGLKSEARDLEQRIDLQKRLCWAQERRQIEIEMAQLRIDIDRLYLSRSFDELKKEVDAIP